MPVDNSKKITVLSNLLKETPEADDATYIGVIDKRLEKNSEINLEALERFAKKIVEETAPTKRPLEMNVILLDSEEISALNEKHLSKTGPTDVLAFPIEEPDSETDDHYEETAEVEMKKMEKILIERHVKHLRVNDV